MGLLKRLFAPAETIVADEILDGLLADYIAEAKLAKQLRDHAALAPYPQAAERLNVLAAAEEAQAERLRREIIGRGGNDRLAGAAKALADGSAKSARNHWARMVLDLDEDRAAGKRYLEQAIRWEDHDAALGDLLHELQREEQRHRHALQDLAARADPQALN
jgi:hypothetical protein